MAMDATGNGRSRRIAQNGVVGSNGNGPSARAVPPLRVDLLGGFRVRRIGAERPVSGWPRRTAKALTKLLATHPRHALHREEILEILWPGVEVESALNRFGKALHAARRALEPELPPRGASAYLRMTDSMLALNTDNVAIDADHFQQLAESALGQGDVAAYETALAAYGGELLPEDRYQDWCAERRAFLAELRIRLMVELAEALEKRGAYSAATDHLREVLQDDPTREDVHRRLMILYAEVGTRNQAVRQFQLCRDVLHRELGLVPEESTLAVYQDVLAERIPRRSPAPERDRGPIEPRRVLTGEQTLGTPCIGRDSVLQHLREQLMRSDDGQGRMILVSGEAGVGKTRLAAELAAEARRRGVSVLWGGSGAYANHLAYVPFAVAMEGYVASRPDAERDELAQRYPALAHFVPSLGLRAQSPPLADRPGDELYLVPAIVGLLTDLARTRPVLLVLDDLHDLHGSSLDVLEYLAHLAIQRRWLIVGTFREEGFQAGSELRRMIQATMGQGLCHHVRLQNLARQDCDELVRAMLAGGGVDDALLDHVYTRSLGNPLFVEGLVREMQDRGELGLTNGSWHTAPSPSASVPACVRALVATGIAPMDESARRVLSLAAASGEMEISLTDLRTGAAALQPPVSDVALFDALDRALEVRILEERRGSYSFRHPLVRAALYEDLTKHRRDQLHAALDRSAVVAKRNHSSAAATRRVVA
jgi:DNA-binding SARP family transcriptional activator